MLATQIALAWRGCPLTSHQVIVDRIANTRTETGLRLHYVLDTGLYPTDTTYTDKDMAALPLSRHQFQGEWNYTLLLTDTP